MQLYGKDSDYSILPTPRCFNLVELSSANSERERLRHLVQGWDPEGLIDCLDPISKHLLFGLALTVGSACGSHPPSREKCLAAFTATNKGKLMAGARAWSKHSHRSEEYENGGTKRMGWWGKPSGPVAGINEKSLELFERVMDGATWKNLHWLPHQILVYEVRVEEGYGMRWSQDRSGVGAVGGDLTEETEPPWTMRGFVEPMMENGHELGWRH
ncbi:hypothetical protein BJ138DRAFT_1157046 [Hygrophoropsis aurantiaca]|uniref:Uncharacterized protein n=1 Tax=Hygrophoropsis aurantiaca TaxID=72124 RepID=A0ACB8A6K4_9AGAM|nr:hypothetical protein BJ138DRAFT_1157046 [Hygrophoropsis aurantiaca]